ncbi:MAG: flagellar protein FlaG [Nitrosospira sp.]|nr:flagellar protein FlaG [Nitrosospira sp.]
MRIEQPGNGSQPMGNPMVAAGQGTPVPRATPAADEAPAGPKPAPIPRAEAVKEASPPDRSTLEFSVDPETGRAVVKIIDSATQDLVRQIPMEEMLDLARSLDQIKGLLLHAEA